MSFPTPPWVLDGWVGLLVDWLALDRAANLWVATEGGGLYTAPVAGTSPLRFRNVVLPGGRAGEYISGLAVDGHGRLWASGEAGPEKPRTTVRLPCRRK